jgi:hypothetical protein
LANLDIKGAVSSDTRELRIADAEADMHIYDWSRSEPVPLGGLRNAHWLRNPSSVSAITAGIKVHRPFKRTSVCVPHVGLKPLKASDEPTDE